jgi:RNA polymerase sigma factor (sigma-70 family)
MYSLFNVAATVIILSKSEQSELVAVYQDGITTDDDHNVVTSTPAADAALGRLVQANLRMAMSVAKKRFRTGLDMDDLVSEAVSGILRAAVTFDPTKGAAFSSYARQWMVANVQTFVQANVGQIRCGTRTAKKLFASLTRLRRQFGSDVTPEVIARELGLDADDVRAALSVISSRAVSIDRPVGDADGATIGELIPMDRPLPDEAMDRTQAGAAIRDAIEAFAATLKPNHADVLRRRVLADYMGEDKADANSFGVTKQRVSQIEKAVTLKFQSFLTNRFGSEALAGMMGA